MTMQFVFEDVNANPLGEFPGLTTQDAIPLVGDQVKFINASELWTGTVTARLLVYLPTVPGRPAFLNVFLTLKNVHAGYAASE